MKNFEIFLSLFSNGPKQVQLASGLILLLCCMQQTIAGQAVIQRITGTPAFIVASSAPDVMSGKRIVGAQVYNVFSRELDALLKLTQ